MSHAVAAGFGQWETVVLWPTKEKRVGVIQAANKKDVQTW
jgi:hypothetical protein